MTVQALADTMERIASTRFAEDWDNVGLLVGDPAGGLAKVGLCIDYTADVADEVRREGCEAVIVYHPPIFKPIKRLTGGLVFDAVRDGIALYSPHTALDVAAGGTNDVLADAMGIGPDREPLKPIGDPADVKLVTFVEMAHVERVAAALFDAGGGHIGDYSRCSFRTPGTGTFLGGASTNPTVGEAGKLETTNEIRLETVVPDAAIGAAVAALRETHPYEEPAFDLYPLAATPRPGGLGRLGRLAESADRSTIVDRVKAELGVASVLVAGPTKGIATTGACCAGSCGDLLHAAIANGADVYLTGELRHHDALAAAAAGMTVICALHSNSERKTLAVLADRLRKEIGVDTHLCASDRDPFAIV